jgi:hypothetical protein
MTCDGTAHGKMDGTTAKGADLKDVALEVLDSVANGKNDFIVAATTSPKAAIWARLLRPGFCKKYWSSDCRSQKKKSKKTDSGTFLKQVGVYKSRRWLLRSGFRSVRTGSVTLEGLL